MYEAIVDQTLEHILNKFRAMIRTTKYANQSELY